MERRDRLALAPAEFQATRLPVVRRDGIANFKGSNDEYLTEQGLE